MLRLQSLAKYAWASPNTLLGLLFWPAARCFGGGAKLVSGVIEIHGGLVAWLLEHVSPIDGGAMALTLGHVVLGRSTAALDVSRDHERVHVRQYERWGPFFLPAYAAAGLWAALRGRNFYRDNRFEVEAYEKARIHR